MGTVNAPDATAVLVDCCAAGDPARQLMEHLLAEHGGDHAAAMLTLARMYLIARHGMSVGFGRGAPAP